MKTTKMTGLHVTCSDVPFAQIAMPTLASVGDGFQGTGVSTSALLETSMRDRAFAVRCDAIHVDVIDYPSTHKFANGVSRSAPDRPPV